MRRSPGLFIGLLIAALIHPLHAATVPDAPTVAAVSIGEAKPPVIDGDISDEIWSRARRIEKFYQMEPQPLTGPSESTEVWILHDRLNLYFAFHVHYRNPDEITVTTMERDAVLRNDDVMRVILDPRQSRRDGYMFEVNAAGSRTDALLIGSGSQQGPVDKWNMLWQAKSRRVADGWTAEIALPFRGLSYDPASSSWGLDIGRQIKQTSELLRWAPTPPGARQMDVSYAGTMTGLTGMTQGNGLDVLAYAQARYTHDWISHNDTVNGKPSATAYYKITPALTGLLTFNTDFSDKPLDSRQVNTSRFSLFEPETREFFLEDADAFEFGSFAGGGAALANGRPFFSRNLGLVRGQIVDLTAGAKLSGNVGGLRIGALSVRTGSSNLSGPQTLSVARLSTNVLAESRIGAIFTHGDPTGLSSNTVAGADFQYRNSNLRPGKRLDATGYYEHSSSSTSGNDAIVGAEIAYPNEPWNLLLRARQIGDNFNPALGFTNRPGIRAIYTENNRIRRFSNAFLRRINLQAAAFRTMDLHNHVESRDEWFAAEFNTHNNDTLLVAVDNYVEVLSESFLLPGNVMVPAGWHDFVRWTADMQTSPSRPFSVHWNVVCCDYYNGSSTESNLQLAWNPGIHFTASLGYWLQPIDLPGGSTTIHIESLNATLNFTPEMKLATELQYDNVSHHLGGSLRYRWEMRPTTELLLTLGESAQLTGEFLHGSYHSQATAAAVRIGHRFQY
jgi:hypothetical protein